MSKIQKAIRDIEKTRRKGVTSDQAVTLGVLVERSEQLAHQGTEDESEYLGDETRHLAALDSDKVIRSVEVIRESLREAGFIAPEEEEQQIIDQYRQIKRPLVAHAFGKRATKIEGGHLILVSSALSGDGKTFSCINLALSMSSEQDRSVLLIDGDVAKAHVSRLFGIDDQPGLTDLLQRDSKLDLNDVILNTDIEGLSLMASGRMNKYTTELFASNRMERLIKALSAQDPNRIIIFDSSPLLSTSEARVLTTLVGQIVLVVCAGKTPRNAVLQALDLIEEGKAVNLVLNQARNTSSDGYYGSYYGYGAGDGSTGRSE